MLSLKSGDADIHSWAFAVIPDKPPVIKFSGEPKRAVNGTLELNYTIEDDYGAASAVTEFALAEPPAKNARPLYPGARNAARPCPAAAHKAPPPSRRATSPSMSGPARRPS